MFVVPAARPKPVPAPLSAWPGQPPPARNHRGQTDFPAPLHGAPRGRCAPNQPAAPVLRWSCGL